MASSYLKLVHDIITRYRTSPMPSFRQRMLTCSGCDKSKGITYSSPSLGPPSHPPFKHCCNDSRLTLNIETTASGILRPEVINPLNLARPCCLTYLPVLTVWLLSLLSLEHRSNGAFPMVWYSNVGQNFYTINLERSFPLSFIGYLWL